MFHVFSSPRSGSTLLAQCLSAHPALHVPDETDFIVPTAFVLDRIADPSLGRRLIGDFILGARRFPEGLGESLSPSEVRAIVASAPFDRRIITELFAEVAKKCGKRLCGDKSPDDLLSLRILHKQGFLDPPSRVVHLVRDVREVMASLHQLDWVRDLDLYFARNWSDLNLYLYELLRGREHYILVRYEDLIADPREQLSRICRHLGFAFEEAMLDPRRRHARYRERPGHSRIYDPIRPDTEGPGRISMGPSHLAWYESQARDGLVTFGYLSA